MIFCILAVGPVIFEIGEIAILCFRLIPCDADEWSFETKLSHVMRKPVLAICEQQSCRSAYASAQSDQHLCFRCLASIIPLVSVSEISSLYIASVAEQAGLSLTWSETPKTDRFSRDEAHIPFYGQTFKYTITIKLLTRTLHITSYLPLNVLR